MASLAAFGATWTASVPYPVLRLARNVAIGRFIHRFEPFFMAVWYISVYIKTSLLVFLTGKLLAAVFNQENYRLLCAIILILAFPLAFLPPDQLSVFHLQFGFAKVVSIVVGVVLPLVLLPFTFKGGVQNEKESALAAFSCGASSGRMLGRNRDRKSQIYYGDGNR